MELPILNKILVQVEKIGTDLTDFKQQVNQSFEMQNQKITEVKQELKEEIKKFIEVDETQEKIA